MESTAVRSARPAVRLRSSWTRLLVGFALLYGVLGGTSAVDATGRWGPAILAAVLLTALVVEKALFATGPAQALRRLGFGRPRGRVIAVAAAVSGAVLLVYPLSAALSGASVRLRPDWPWLALGVFAFHGLAEELVWRGFGPAT